VPIAESVRPKSRRGALTLALLEAGARVIAVRRAVEQGGLRRFQARPGLTLPRNAFVPPPLVDSAVLQLRRRNCSDLAAEEVANIPRDKHRTPSTGGDQDRRHRQRRKRGRGER
jgi:hypothetical protein